LASINNNFTYLLYIYIFQSSSLDGQLNEVEVTITLGFGGQVLGG